MVAMPPSADVPTRSPVLRFAPSPTGYLHLGHALSALTNRDLARNHGGQFLIRIEDIDTTRCRPEYTAAILEDLEWLGVHSDGPILRQSEHLPVYDAAAARLADLGLLYPCFATRQEIAAAADPHCLDPDGAPIYPGLYRNLPAADVARRRAQGVPIAMRLDIAKAVPLALQIAKTGRLSYTELGDGADPVRIPVNPYRWGDVVIQRKETTTSYHLSVVVDDARQAITHVVRGEDLRAATDIHRLLQVLLELPEPRYLHHRLVVDEAGRKLSKRHGDASIASLRRLGATPADIRRKLGVVAEMQL